MSYNPFDKPIGEKLMPDDLKALIARDVAEGYFIEYKSVLPEDRQKIARSIASFANTYGGWYIVGVRTTEHNVAVEVPGFAPKQGDHDPISVVTEVVKIGIDPSPLFHSQIVVLASGNLVLVVYVPEGQNTPFITRDGRIYRRTHDSSSPLSETSRHALDELVARGEKQKALFKKFAADDRGIEEKYDTQARVCVYISPSPLGVIRKPGFTAQDEVATLLADSKKAQPLDELLKGVTGNIPLDTALIRQQSIILRQVNKGNEPYYGLSIELDTYGRCKITAPLKRVLADVEAYAAVSSKECRDFMFGRFEDYHQSLTQLTFFDISETWMILTGFVAFYLRWLKAPPTVDGFDIAVEAIAVNQHAPFIDMPEWATHVKSFGLPVTLTHRSRVPEFYDEGWYAEPSKLWLTACSLTGRAFGLPTEFMAPTLIQTILNSKPPPQ